MFKWAPYPFLRITVSFIAGILLYVYTGSQFRYSAELTAFFIATYLLAFAVAQKARTVTATNAAGILGLLCFVAGGAAITHIHTASGQKDHLAQLAIAPSYYIGTVDDYVVQKPGYQNTVLRLESVQVQGNWQQVAGKIQLSVPDDDAEQLYGLSYGDRLLIKGAPQAVPPPANPHQFDYRAFLENKNIIHRHALQRHQFLKLGADPANPVLYYSILLRRKLDAVLRERVGLAREYGISSALVLGVKDELDNAVRSAYTNTGTMHVLAVSGLHVGLLYLVLMWALSKFGKGRTVRIASAGIVLSVLWLYAFMTGLSPSVLRAVVMFSLVTIALAIKRQTNIYNTVAIAAFVLLAYNPYYLFEVSFQLSFAAVLGIVYLQPKLQKLLDFDHPVLRYAWALFTVSVAAQLATMPLGIYYFHQFPVYFWMANIPVIPLAMLALYSGVAALALYGVPVLSKLLFLLHTGSLWLMNECNLFLSNLPQAVIDGITISKVQALLLYILLLLLILFLALKKLKYFAFATVVVGVLSVQQLLIDKQQQKQKVLTVYSLRGNTALSFMEGQQAIVVSDSVLQQHADAFNYNIRPHLWHRGIKETQRQLLYTSGQASNLYLAQLPDSNSVYVWQGKRLLLLDKPLRVQAQEPLAVDYILLARNAPVKPEELLQFEFKQVLLDASSYPWYLQQMRDKLNELQISFHDIATSGAFVVELE
ncbi:ComEC/Rec2 family competence protein [Pontibacter sp. SGAir0037]|uniref:ComEC/Rec2 family competence protein n=1 Tax=Pontibacter sp. SGAir0037 TaxID=2571030 RepID=UPI0010CD225B|nr:ComEC/Rec2 family competence protein [Pontibacter sp. SGAir0037]QCR21147.1 competence protein ComEC [Pontibacter sp. SGAir0037]